ncbi:MAG: restriction endonuclease subunit S, partial [Clostridia bacterium]|nr:restriction endonuclease subunit S [Clostridia bacterium]
MVYEQKHAIQKTMDVETRYINKEKYDELQRFNVKGGDIIVSCRGTIGETFIVPEDAPLGIMHPSIMKIRLKDGVYDKYYFNTLLKMRLRSHESAANGSGVKMAISAKELGKELFPVPPIIEQKTITQILLQVELLLAKRKQQLQQLDELVKARFVELFGDVLTNEKSWETAIWNDVLTIKNGKNQKQVENPTGQYPICGSGGIMGYADNYISEANSVIIGRKGNINKPILMREKYWNVDTAFGLEPNNKFLLVDFLFLFCVLFDFEKLNKAVTIPSLTKADLLKIEMPIPPIELQNEFADFVKQIDKSK